MSIKIYPFEVQHKGGFNNGEIVENKPIQLSDDEKLQPYSNIFYWAHAVSENGSTIGEHPHRAFEILSFVLKGSIEHYDSKNRKWIPLKAGDVQIIRSGSGISHSEKLNAAAQMFQIWFDPDIEKTISVPATYDDYSFEKFPELNKYGMNIKYYKGNDAPLEMTTPGISIYELSFDKGSHGMDIEKESIYSGYIVEGEIQILNDNVKENDFIVVNNEDQIKFNALAAGRIFVISSLAIVPYKTYVERYK
jgi:redox-sensitive bicupin YhaK (pirin superfamily)